jgi:CRISPR-associated protein Csh1
LESETDYQSVKEGGDFNMFLILDEPDYEHFKSIHDDYFARNIFNKDEFNKENGEGTVMGVPDSLYTYNGKKPYLQHQSSPFNLKYRTTGEEAKVIWQFYGLQKRVLPNPLPIFIDKRELNKEVVALYNEERKATYTEIIKTLFEKHQKDLGGYYLLFFEKGVLVDVDFVANFEYDISNCELKQCECLNINYSDKKTGELVRWEKQGAVHNIFQFQNTLTNRLLGLDLEPDTKAGGKWLKYFGEVEYNPKYMTDIQYNLFLKYRLAFYNYVYKSRRNAITTLMFYDIMSNGIIDDLRHYEWKDKRHTKQYAIKEKILIWFSLYHFFDQHNSNNIDMINLTQQLHDELKTYAKGDAPAMEHIDPKLFAFASGQLIRQILQQSKSDKRSHALLEPFVQKTDVNQFKLAIARAFETYKHEFTLYSGSKRYELDKTMALVMGADDPNINVKDLLPYTLAGYFSDSVFVKDNVGTASENTEN